VFSSRLEISELDRILFSAIDANGFDGITDATGNMVDGSTRTAAEAEGIDPICLYGNMM